MCTLAIIVVRLLDIQIRKQIQRGFSSRKSQELRVRSELSSDTSVLDLIDEGNDRKDMPLRKSCHVYVYLFASVGILGALFVVPFYFGLKDTGRLLYTCIGHPLSWSFVGSTFAPRQTELFQLHHEHEKPYGKDLRQNISVGMCAEIVGECNGICTTVLNSKHE